VSSVLIESEIGTLEKVILHRPGGEVELMNPQAAQEALFDDIISLAGAQQEHDQLAAALRQFGEVCELQTLLAETMEIEEARRTVIEGLCEDFGCPELVPELLDLPGRELAERLVLGTPSHPTALAQFLPDHAYALPPMFNLYFTRDAAMCVHDRVIVGAMANRTRWPESLVMQALFRHHPALGPAGFYLDGSTQPARVTVEGGDVLVLRDDLILIGQGERTSITGIDRLLQAFAQTGKVRHVIVQEIPKARAFIHFDMVFTMLDRDLCMIYEPIVQGGWTRGPILMELEAGQPPRMERHADLLTLLKELGMPLTPVLTGGREPLHQTREQWQKGTNFFAMAPGKVIGFRRNEHTYRELEQHGFRVVTGEDVLAGRVDLTAPGRVAVAMEGAELSRGGGGCRCMTLPVRRARL
jgi:arginine deiminase